MADLIYGTVKATGKKENVLALYEELEDYYDKYLVSEKGSDNKYTVEFEFSSKLTRFLSYEEDYFLGYSEGYECKIVAELEMEGCEGEEDPMRLVYDNGKIVHGLEECQLPATDVN